MRAAKFWIGFLVGFLGFSYALHEAQQTHVIEAVLLAYIAGAVAGVLVWGALNDD